MEIEIKILGYAIGPDHPPPPGSSLGTVLLDAEATQSPRDGNLTMGRRVTFEMKATLVAAPEGGLGAYVELPASIKMSL